MSVWIATLLAAAAAATATADCPAGGDPAIERVRPDWKTPLSPESILWAYPPQAVKTRQEGRVQLECEIDAEGVPTSCAVTSETPAGFGFGEAALTLRSQMAFTPEHRCGKPVPSSVSIPITFSTGAIEAENSRPVTPEALAWGRRLAAAIRIEEDADAEIQRQGASVLYFWGAERQLTPEQRQTYFKAMQETRPEARRRLTEAVSTALARRMSLSELKATVAFYEGPNGKAFRNARSVFFQQRDAGLLEAVDWITDTLETHYCEISKACADKPASR